MKILHTADWHLGKRLDSFSRLEEQKIVLDEICIIADEQAVDAVIVAGDLFDAFNPPVEAIELLYKTLKRLTNNGKRPAVNNTTQNLKEAFKITNKKINTNSRAK